MTSVVDFIVIKHRLVSNFKKAPTANRRWRVEQRPDPFGPPVKRWVSLYLLKSPVDTSCRKQQRLLDRAVFCLRALHRAEDVEDAAYGRVSQDMPQAMGRGDGLRTERWSLYQIIMRARREPEVRLERSRLGGKTSAERSKRVNETRNRFIEAAYRRGDSMKEIAEKYDMTPRGIRTMLKKRGVEMKGAGRPKKGNTTCTVAINDSQSTCTQEYNNHA